MAKYAFRVTAKRMIAGKIPSGSTVQVIKDQPTTPSPQQILDAYEDQLGIVVKGVSISSSYFDIEKL